MLTNVSSEICFHTSPIRWSQQNHRPTISTFSHSNSNNCNRHHIQSTNPTTLLTRTNRTPNTRSYRKSMDYCKSFIVSSCLAMIKCGTIKSMKPGFVSDDNCLLLYTFNIAGISDISVPSDISVVSDISDASDISDILAIHLHHDHPGPTQLRPTLAVSQWSLICHRDRACCHGRLRLL